jgi:hypothetical protein
MEILQMLKYMFCEECLNFMAGLVDLEQDLTAMEEDLIMDYFWQWLCQQVAETVHSILSSGGHNFTVLSILPSKDMYYGLNTIIFLNCVTLSWLKNIKAICGFHPWQEHFFIEDMFVGVAQKTFELNLS